MSPAWYAAAGLAVLMLLLTRVELPDDLGRWGAGVLAGERVHDLEPGPGGVLVGSRQGLHTMTETGRLEATAVTDVVQAVSRGGDRTWVGTDEGVRVLADSTSAQPARPSVTSRVHDLSVAGETVLVAADDGLHHHFPEGRTVRLWPPAGGPAQSVVAVLPVDGGTLFAHPEGLALLRDGAPEVVLPGVDVVALGRLGDDSLWVGTRGAPLLAVSGDEGRTWQERGDGLGFSATNALAAGPPPDALAVAGGSGLADGTGQAGTQQSRDAGRTWTSEQDRLSNTHVTDLLVRQEPLRLGVAFGGGLAEWSLPLPVTTSRWYAATNGSGVATFRPEGLVPETTGTTVLALRLLEPLALGGLVLALAVPAYRRAETGRRTPRSPPGEAPDHQTTTPDPDRPHHQGDH